MTSRSDAIEALEYDYPGIEPSEAVKAWRRIQEARGTMIVHFQIPGKPKGKGRPRFGNGRTYTPAATQNQEAFIKFLASQAMGDLPCCGEPVAVSIDIAITPPKSMPKRQRDEALCGRLRPAKKPDCDNIVKLISDAFNGIVWVDDSQVVDLTVRKRYAVDDITTVLVSKASAA